MSADVSYAMLTRPSYRVNSLYHCRLCALSVAITYPFTLLVNSLNTAVFNNYKTLSTIGWLTAFLTTLNLFLKGLRHLDICEKTVLILSSYFDHIMLFRFIPYHWWAAFLYWYVLLIRISLKIHNVPEIWGKIFKHWLWVMWCFVSNFISFTLIMF